MRLQIDKIKTNYGTPMDGVLLFTHNGYYYRVGGWVSNGITVDTCERAPVGTTNFTAVANFPYKGHTIPHAKKGDDVYFIGSDLDYPAANSGNFNKQVWKLSGGVFSKVVDDHGMGDRAIGQLVYNPDNDSFYFFGGITRLSISEPGSIQHCDIWISTDDCATWTRIKTDTKPDFTLALCYGAIIRHQGLFWKIGGSVYDDSSWIFRTYDRYMWSSPDAITWTRRGLMPMPGRHYHNMISFKNGFLLFNGFNAGVSNNRNNGNLGSMWFATYSNGNLNWEYLQQTPWPYTHAMAAGHDENGSILCYGGTTNVYRTPPGGSQSVSKQNDLYRISEKI